VIISDTEYGTHNVTVVLRWIRENGVTYNVTVEPEVATCAVINFITMSSAQITLSYNTHYNVTILGTTGVCGRNVNRTIIEFHYGKFYTS
jgi:hypothetical protein